MQASLLTNRQLTIARVTWIVLALFTVIVIAAAIPTRYQVFTTIEDDAARRTGFGELTSAEVQELQSLGLSVQWYGTFSTLLEVIAVPSYMLVSTLLLWLGGKRRDAVLISLLLLPNGAISSSLTDVLFELDPAWQLPALLLKTIGTAGVVISLALFPDGRLHQRWMRWIIAGWLCYVGSWWLFPSLRLNPLIVFISGPQVTSMLVAFFFIGSTLLALLLRYRNHFDSVQRLQTRIVVLSFALNTVILGVIYTPMLLSPALSNSPVYRLVAVSVTMINASLLAFALALAVLRHRLYDIDFIIRRTLIYSILSAILALVFFGSVTVAQQLFRAATGQSSDLAIVLSTLAIAALFTPLHRRVQNTIDRRFYRRKYDAEKTLARFSQTLRDETNLDALKDSMIGVVQSTMQPIHVSLWIREKLSEEHPS